MQTNFDNKNESVNDLIIKNDKVLNSFKLNDTEINCCKCNIYMQV